MKDFYSQTHCDRCQGTLENGRIMSMFNEDCLCSGCKQKEKEHPNYQKALEADHAEIKKGNYNFKGFGL